METARLNLSNDLRVGAIGRTQCGKTTAMHEMMEQQPRVLAVDTKKRLKWKGYSLTLDPAAALLEDHVIYRPDAPIPPDFWEAAMHSLHERGGGIIYLDEAPDIAPESGAPAGLRKVIREGAQLGVGVWWGAQEATGVHNTLIRQSDFVLLFMNSGASDRDKLIKTVGDMGEAPAYLDVYEFVVYGAQGRSYDPQAIPVYKMRIDGT